MSIANITNFETATKEHKEISYTTIDTKIDEFKDEASRSINNKFYPMSSNSSPFSYNQPSTDINKWLLRKSPNFHSHASKFTKDISPMALEGDTLLKIQKWWDAICSVFFRSLSTNKIWPPYKKLKAKNYDITKFFLPQDTHSKYVTEIYNFEALSRSLRVNIF